MHSYGARNADTITKMKPDLDSGKSYSQAHDAYMHSHGSPAMRIPPRPFLQPAIEADKDALGELLKEAAQAALDGDTKLAESKMAEAGMQAANDAFDWFTDSRNGWAPNAPSTIKAKGSDKPLIDTDEMRKSITYVIR